MSIAKTKRNKLFIWFAGLFLLLLMAICAGGIKTQAATVKAGTVSFARTADSKYGYYQFKATKTGTLTISYKGGDSGYIAICNAKKKLISTGTSFTKGDSLNRFSNKLTYGITKGKTYYIRYTGYGTKAKLTVTGVKDSSGSSKAKARAMKAGKSYKGLIAAEQKVSKKDWFKINLDKGRYYFCAYNASSSHAGFTMKIYDATGKELSISTGYGFYEPRNGKSLSNNKVVSLSVFQGGTYYVSIQKNSRDEGYKRASGMYVLGVTK